MDAQAPRSPHRYEALPVDLGPQEQCLEDSAERAGSRAVPPGAGRVGGAGALPFLGWTAEGDVADEGPGPFGGFFGRAGAVRAGVQRATSAFLEMAGLQESETATFACPFCLEEAPARQRVVLRTCGDAAHGVCRDCLVAWVTSLVNDGDISGLVCPEASCHNGSDGSRARASDSEIRSLLGTDAEALARYERFLKIREDDTLRDCPYGCKEMVKPGRGQFGEVIKEMRCDACQGEFCFHHANAHVGRPCEEYAREQAQNLRRQGSNPLQQYKCCPKCGIHSEHSGGCNHMTCKVCKTHWCWSCGEEIKTPEDPYRHFREGPCQMMDLGNQEGGELFLEAELLRERVPCLDRCMAPLHHLLWSGSIASAIYCPVHYDGFWDAQASVFKLSLCLGLLCCCCDPCAPVVFLILATSLMLLWPAALLTALWSLLSRRLLRPAILRRHEAVPDALEYILLTPVLASLACLRFTSGVCRACGQCCPARRPRPNPTR